MAEWKGLAGLGTGLTIGLFLLITSCVVNGVYWNLLCLIPYFIIPVPSLMCSSANDILQEENGWKILGDFTSGFLIVSVFAIPAVIYHVHSISGIGLLISIIANVVVFLSIIGYVWYKKNDSAGFSV